MLVPRRGQDAARTEMTQLSASRLSHVSAGRTRIVSGGIVVLLHILVALALLLHLKAAKQPALPSRSMLLMSLKPAAPAAEMKAIAPTRSFAPPAVSLTSPLISVSPRGITVPETVPAISGSGAAPSERKTSKDLFSDEKKEAFKRFFKEQAIEDRRENAKAAGHRSGIFAPILDRLFLEEAFERLLLLVGEEILGGLALGRRRARTRDRWHRFGNRDAAGRNADQGRCQTDRRRRKASGRSDGLHLRGRRGRLQTHQKHGSGGQRGLLCRLQMKKKGQGDQDMQQYYDTAAHNSRSSGRHMGKTGSTQLRHLGPRGVLPPPRDQHAAKRTCCQMPLHALVVSVPPTALRSPRRDARAGDRRTAFPARRGR